MSTSAFFYSARVRCKKCKNIGDPFWVLMFPEHPGYKQCSFCFLGLKPPVPRKKKVVVVVRKKKKVRR